MSMRILSKKEQEYLKRTSFFGLLASKLGITGYRIAEDLGINHGRYAGFRRGGCFHPKFLTMIATLYRGKIDIHEIFELLTKAKFKEDVIANPKIADDDLEQSAE